MCCVSFLFHKNISCSPTNSRQLQDEYLNRFATFLDETINKPIKKDTRLKDLEPHTSILVCGVIFF